MPTPQEKLADSLEILHRFQSQGRVAIRSTEISRVHRERLAKNGFLIEVVKGWWIPTHPQARPGDTTPWYASYWGFIAQLLNQRFGTDWHLDPDQSLRLHVDDRTVPRQLIVHSPKASNNVLALPHETSLLDIRQAVPVTPHDVVGLPIDSTTRIRVLALPVALVRASPAFFTDNRVNAQLALSRIRDASDLLRPLLAGGHSAVAGRLAGAMRAIGESRIADEIGAGMKAAGYVIAETDPFDRTIVPQLSLRGVSPHVGRIKLLWETMRPVVIDEIPRGPGLPNDVASYLKDVEDRYVADAYHSLSIEGYRVSRELIERVRSGAWNPDHDDSDRQNRDALAARGYWEAFQAVKQSLGEILAGANPGAVVDRDLSTWYRQLFQPSIAAGILKPEELAGYRAQQVYIQNAMHVPPSQDAVRDLMPAFFELLTQETEASVRAVLGHFVFVFIHPYMDGNGRLGRFLMNAMLASGGYPWTVIRVENRTGYLRALEAGSTGHDIRPFAQFIRAAIFSNQAHLADDHQEAPRP